MKVRSKLFVAMASFVVSMCIIFGLLTQFIVRESVNAAVKSTRGEQIEALSEPLVAYYGNNKQSWAGIQQARLDGLSGSDDRQISFLLVSPQGQILLQQGMKDDLLIKSLGIRKSVQWNGETIAWMYYYDPDVAMLSKLRIGIPISVLSLLIPSAVLFIGICLLVAWWLSRRLTAPLLQLMPAIDRLGRGDFGIQAAVVTQDEYGQVAAAFNGMSRLLQRAELQRRNLVADVAHELRTPITIIRGHLELAQLGGRPIEPGSLLPLQDELLRLTRLVDDLHQLSLAEAKKLPLERKTIDMQDLLHRIVDRVTPDAEQKRIRLTLTCEVGSPVIEADPNRLTQVFLNITVNAIRYTPPDGSIAISIREEAADEGGIRIVIADSGPGIEAHHLPHIFDRFYRTDEARTRNSGGAGLGLAIAKGFITAHNGTIEVESTVGQGTAFIVRLPRK